ncbi:MAG: winged helix-turn-helix domain-containing protein [Xanthomonadales bacterium]|nr:winged helix-turn-helix domain-containing protein [Xanthomonadales bacterium]
MIYQSPPACLQIGSWRFDPSSGELEDGVRRVRLEPRSAAVLAHLAASPDEMISREQLIAAVWADTVVGEDALARAIFKLRRALGDDSKAAAYIETIPKRGYRLIAPVGAVESAPRKQAEITRKAPHAVTLVLLAAGIIAGVLTYWQLNPESPKASQPAESAPLIARAQDFYHRYSRADNEAAIELYERILTREPDKPDALAGLSNALVQRVIRWPELADGEHAQFRSLGAALANGHLTQPRFARVLERAELLARHALSLEPDNPLLHRSLGLVLGAQARLDEAIAEYRAAIALDPDAWGAMINLAEMLGLQGNGTDSLAMFVSAYEAMTRRYETDKQHIEPWYTELAVLIGDRLQLAGRSSESESWYRRALQHAPLNPAATAALAELLAGGGREAEAQQLCAELLTRVGAQTPCPRRSEAEAAD